MGQDPEEVIYAGTPAGYDLGLDDRNVRLYIFHIIVGVVAYEYHIREDKEAFYGSEAGAGDQLPHFNSGEVKSSDKKDKLKKHHYWTKQK